MARDGQGRFVRAEEGEAQPQVEPEGAGLAAGHGERTIAPRGA